MSLRQITEEADYKDPALYARLQETLKNQTDTNGLNHWEIFQRLPISEQQKETILTKLAQTDLPAPPKLRRTDSQIVYGNTIQNPDHGEEKKT